MNIVFEIFGIAVFLALCAFWAVFVPNFVKDAKALPEHRSDPEYEKGRSKKYFKWIYQALLANGLAVVLAGLACLGSVLCTSEKLSFEAAPLLVLVVGGFVVCMVLEWLFEAVATKGKLKNMPKGDKKATPIQALDKKLFGLSFALGYMFAAVFANLIYMCILLF